MRYLRLLFIACVFASGCSSSGAVENGARQEFETGRLQSNFSIGSNQLDTDMPVYFSVKASCEPPPCTPEEAIVSFHMNPGRNTFFTSTRDLELWADGQEYSFPGIDRTNIYTTPPVIGLLKRASFSWSEFMQIADAQDVSGSLYGQAFEWSFENRAPLRALIKSAAEK